MTRLKFCSTCGCAVTPDEAKAKGWGTILELGTKHRAPQCSRECALVLYTPEYVERAFTGPEVVS